MIHTWRIPSSLKADVLGVLAAVMLAPRVCASAAELGVAVAPVAAVALAAVKAKVAASPAALRIVRKARLLAVVAH